MKDNNKDYENDRLFADDTPLYKPRTGEDEAEADDYRPAADAPASRSAPEPDKPEETDRRGKARRDPLERVSRMNGIFDRLILPIIGFTLLVFIIFGLAPRIAESCAVADDDPGSSGVAETGDYAFYTSRAELLGGIADNASLFEDNGYTLVDNNGVCVAYKKLDNGMEVMENLKDKNGNVYSTVIFTAEDGSGLTVTLMIYSRRVFLAIAELGEDAVSAIFEDESFTAEVSPADADQTALLALAPSEVLVSMLEAYKDNFSALLA